MPREFTYPPGDRGAGRRGIIGYLTANARCVGRVNVGISGATREDEKQPRRGISYFDWRSPEWPHERAASRRILRGVREKGGYPLRLESFPRTGRSAGGITQLRTPPPAKGKECRFGFLLLGALGQCSQ